MMVKLEPVEMCRYEAQVPRNEVGGANNFALAMVGL